VITEQTIHDAISFLLEHQPPQLHITLLTRVDPPLPLGRLRVRGQILELRTDQLRRTSQEAAAFLTGVMGLSLTAEKVQEMETRTEGWIAGLQLAALSMRGRSEASDILSELRGSQRHILDYLTDEVLRHQRTALQTFLYCTSILERLSAPLCDALMQQSGSQEMLDELERANLFVISLDSQRRRYRYHALFAEALRYRLQQLDGVDISLLHLRACLWYAEQGYLNEAIQHALLAQAWQRAADLIESNAGPGMPLFSRGSRGQYGAGSNNSLRRSFVHGHIFVLPTLEACASRPKPEQLNHGYRLPKRPSLPPLHLPLTS
jgi:LuxR family transcriptional regulator, maltose regulon positive regulatory protein